MNGRIYVVCRTCGHEREVSRADVLKGVWRKQLCPVCESRNRQPPRSWSVDDLLADERLEES